MNNASYTIKFSLVIQYVVFIIILFTANFFCLAQTKDSVWIQTSSGCKAYNPNPVKNETITWTGDCKNGYAWGQGKLTWFKNGKQSDVYEGEFFRGTPNGYGKYEFDNGTVMEGEFKNGKLNGKGKRIEKGKNGKLNYYYEGDFKENDCTGYGLEIYLDDAGDTISIYQGNFEQDIRKGQAAYYQFYLNQLAIITFSNFENNLPEGSGLLFYFPGGISFMDIEPYFKKAAPPLDIPCERYEGNLVKGIEQGQGTYYRKNSRYEGSWNNGLKEGVGSLYIKNALIYKGSWKDDKFDGYGVQYQKDTIIYSGYWKDNLRDGFGIFRYKNYKNIYIGEFKKNLFNGLGVVMTGSAIIKGGIWYNGDLQAEGTENAKRKLLEKFPERKGEILQIMGRTDN